MGILKGLTDSIGGTFGDQWRDIITAGQFDETMVVGPGISQGSNNGRGQNIHGSAGVITEGSIIRIPENVAAFIFSQSAIEQVITEPGEFIYQDGEASVFSGGGLKDAIVNNVTERFKFGGQASEEKRVAFVNLREIRGMKFGTPGPVLYNDHFYGADLELIARGTYSVQISDPVRFVQNFLPPNTDLYSFSDEKARAQIGPEFLQSFIHAVNSLSQQFRISELPSKNDEIVSSIFDDEKNAGSWDERFGFKVTGIAIETISLTDDSRELVKQYSSNKMSVNAYQDVSQRTANIAAQQKIAQGVQDNGLGEGGGMLMGMNLGQSLNPQTGATEQTNTMTLDEQIAAVKKLKELLDIEAITQEEFEQKKKELLGL